MTLREPVTEYQDVKLVLASSSPQFLNVSHKNWGERACGGRVEMRREGEKNETN